MSRGRITAPQSAGTTEKSEHRGAPITPQDVLKMASMLGVPLLAASCLGGSVVNVSQATQVGPETKTPIPTVPSVATPEPSRAPTATPQPVEGPMTGLYYGLRKDANGKDTFVGGISGKSIDDGLKAKGLSGYTVPTVGGFYGVEVNTYYSKNDPNQPVAFSLDEQYLMKYFNVTTGKDGSMKGQIPGDGVVEKKENMWVATIGGKQMVLNPFIMSRAGEKFGAPVILEKGGALFFALVDPATGALVTDPQNAFQEPGAVAKANGFKGTQAVGSVELTKSGLMIVKGTNGKFLAELNFTGKAVTFEQWVQTSTPDAKLLQQAEAAYAKAMGIDVANIETAVETRIGVNGPFAVVVDKATGVPLLIAQRDQKSGELGWESATLRLGEKNGTGMGTTVDGSENYSNPLYDTRVKEFSLINPSGSTAPKTIDVWNGLAFAKKYSQFAKDNNSGFRPGHFFYRSFHEEPPYKDLNNKSPEEIKLWMEQRVDLLLDPNNIPYLNSIIFANEPVAVYNGKPYWVTENNPYYKAYGEKWPIEAYSLIYQKLIDKGLTPGKDVHLMINLPYDPPEWGYTPEFTIQFVTQLKADLKARFGKDVPLDVGIQFHLRDVPADQVPWEDSCRST